MRPCFKLSLTTSLEVLNAAIWRKPSWIPETHRCLHTQLILKSCHCDLDADGNECVFRACVLHSRSISRHEYEQGTLYGYETLKESWGTWKVSCQNPRLTKGSFQKLPNFGSKQIVKLMGELKRCILRKKKYAWINISHSPSGLRTSFGLMLQRACSTQKLRTVRILRINTTKKFQQVISGLLFTPHINQHHRFKGNRCSNSGGVLFPALRPPAVNAATATPATAKDWVCLLCAA